MVIRSHQPVHVVQAVVQAAQHDPRSTQYYKLSPLDIHDQIPYSPKSELFTCCCCIPIKCGLVVLMIISFLSVINLIQFVAFLSAVDAFETPVIAMVSILIGVLYVGL